MFKAPFSFNGRIRRMEYGLTLIILWAVTVFCNVLIFFALNENVGAAIGAIILILLYVPMCWVSLSQGAKRCHDVGKNGWYQLIPFYFFILLFQDGQPGENQYGLNPKGISNNDSYDEQINQIGKSLEP